MSLTFSQITGLIDDIADSDENTYPIADKTRDVNLALDRAFALIFETGGTWQFDDSNHTDYPIITTNLVSGQRDYTFVTDETGNLILEIQKVVIADTAGRYTEVFPVDVPNGTALPSYFDGINTGGIPNTYEKNATGFFLDPIPNYNSTNGLKVYISREGSYFSTSDTTKKPGIAGLFHEYLALRPAYQFAFRKGMAKAQSLREEVERMEGAMMDYYTGREKDVQKRLMAVRRNSR